jgi:hypothetical protein
MPGNATVWGNDMAAITYPTQRRTTALVLLLAAWALALGAERLGDRHHAVALTIAFLLWRIWRGGTWSRTWLTAFSTLSAALGVAMLTGLAVGARGLVLSTLWASLLFAGVGVIVNTPAVRRLAHRADSASA